MDKQNEDAIRDRAYALWVEAGSPDGDDQRFWHEAERELSTQSDLDSSADGVDVAKPPLLAGLPNI